MKDAVLTIMMRTENAAFEAQPGAEAARILRDLADKLESNNRLVAATLEDCNGNLVGHYRARPI